MANPAELLLQQFESWSIPNKDRKDSRSLRTDSQAWEKHLRAAHLLTDIKEALSYTYGQGFDVSVYENAYKSWVKMLWNYPGSWTAGGHGFDETQMNYLRAAASLFSAVLPEFKDGEQSQSDFNDFLTALSRRISTLDDKHKHLKAHALRIVRHIQGCLDDLEVYGEFRIFSALEDLQRLLDVLTEQVEHEDGFFRKAKAGMWSFFKKNATVLALSTAAIGGQSAIESAAQDLYELIKNDVKAISTQEKTAAIDSGDTVSDS